MVQPAQGQQARPTASRTGFWSGGSLDDLFEQRRRPARRIRWPRCSARRWANGAVGARRRRRHQPQLGPRAHRPRHHGDRAARDGPAGALDDLPRLGRRHRAVHRPVRHGLGHHALASPPSPRCTTPTSPWSRRASPRRCSPPRSAWWRRSPRCWPTTRSATTSPASPSRLEGFGAEFSAILSRQSESAVAEPIRAAAPVAE